MSSTAAIAPAHANSAPQRTFRIPVSTGIFDHYREVGDALWLLLFYIDRTTEERSAPNGKFSGTVLGGRPVRDTEAAKTFGCAVYTIRRWRRRLVSRGIIRARRTPFGAVIEVVNSQKWHVKSREGTGEAAVREARRGACDSQSGVCNTRRPLPRIEEGRERNAQFKEDNTGMDSTRHRQKSAAKAAEQPVQNTRLPWRRPVNHSSVNQRTERMAARSAVVDEKDLVPISEILGIIRKAKSEFEAKHGK
jgi:hypothetical protein